MNNRDHAKKVQFLAEAGVESVKLAAACESAANDADVNADAKPLFQAAVICFGAGYTVSALACVAATLRVVNKRSA